MVFLKLVKHCLFHEKGSVLLQPQGTGWSAKAVELDVELVVVLLYYCLLLVNAGLVQQFRPSMKAKPTHRASTRLRLCGYVFFANHKTVSFTPCEMYAANFGC